MFKVKSIYNGRTFTVYAVSGTRFLIWNDNTEDEHWEWQDMDRFKPVEAAE